MLRGSPARPLKYSSYSFVRQHHLIIPSCCRVATDAAATLGNSQYDRRRRCGRRGGLRCHSTVAEEVSGHVARARRTHAHWRPCICFASQVSRLARFYSRLQLRTDAHTDGRRQERDTARASGAGSTTKLIGAYRRRLPATRAAAVIMTNVRNPRGSRTLCREHASI